MSSLIHDWAVYWNIPPHILADLARRVNAGGNVIESPPGATTEAGASKHVELQAAKAGDVLWRNNVGATPARCKHCGNEQVPVRYGLANSSSQMNKHIKSSDRIGIRRVCITPEMVGTIIGQFVAREVKKPGWKYTGNGRETAQLNFINIVNAMGGDGKFTTGDY